MASRRQETVDQLIEELSCRPVSVATLASGARLLQEFAAMRKDVELVIETAAKMSGESTSTALHMSAMAASVFERERTTFLRMLEGRARRDDARAAARLLWRMWWRQLRTNARRRWARWVRATWLACRRRELSLTEARAALERRRHSRLRGEGVKRMTWRRGLRRLLRCVQAWRRHANRCVTARRALLARGRRVEAAKATTALRRWSRATRELRSTATICRLHRVTARRALLAWGRRLDATKLARALHRWLLAARELQSAATIVRLRRVVVDLGARARLRRTLGEMRAHATRRRTLRHAVAGAALRRRLRQMGVAMQQWRVVVARLRTSELACRAATLRAIVRWAFGSICAHTKRRRTLRRLVSGAAHRRRRRLIVAATQRWLTEIVSRRARDRARRVDGVRALVARLAAGHMRASLGYVLVCWRRATVRAAAWLEARRRLATALRRRAAYGLSAAWFVWSRLAADVGAMRFACQRLATRQKSRQLAAALCLWSHLAREVRTTHLVFQSLFAQRVRRNIAGAMLLWSRLARDARALRLACQRLARRRKRQYLAAYVSLWSRRARTAKCRVAATRIVASVTCRLERRRALSRWSRCTNAARMLVASASRVTTALRRCRLSRALALWNRHRTTEATKLLLLLLPFVAMRPASWRRRQRALAHWRSVTRDFRIFLNAAALTRAIASSSFRATARAWATWRRAIVGSAGLEMTACSRARQHRLAAAFHRWTRARRRQQLLARTQRRRTRRRLARAIQAWRSLPDARLPLRRLATIWRRLALAGTMRTWDTRRFRAFARLHARHQTLRKRADALRVWQLATSRSLVDARLVAVAATLATSRRRLAAFRSWSHWVVAVREAEDFRKRVALAGLKRRARLRRALRRLLSRAHNASLRRGLGRWSRRVEAVRRGSRVRLTAVACAHLARITSSLVVSALARWRAYVAALRRVEESLPLVLVKGIDPVASAAKRILATSVPRNATPRDLAVVARRVRESCERAGAARVERRLRARASAGGVAVRRFLVRKGRQQASKALAVWATRAHRDRATTRLALDHSRQRERRHLGRVFRRWHDCCSERRVATVVQEHASIALTLARVFGAWVACAAERRRLRAIVHQAALKPGQRDIAEYIRDLLVPPSRGAPRRERGVYARTLRRRVVGLHDDDT